MDKLADVMQHLPDVIVAAGSHPYGLAALGIVVLSAVALFLFDGANERTKLIVFLLLFAGIGSFAFLQSGYSEFRKARIWSIKQTGGPGWKADWTVRFDGTPFDCNQIHESGERLTASCRAFSHRDEAAIIKYNVGDGNSCVYKGSYESPTRISGDYFCEKGGGTWEANAK